MNRTLSTGFGSSTITQEESETESLKFEAAWIQLPPFFSPSTKPSDDTEAIVPSSIRQVAALLALDGDAFTASRPGAPFTATVNVSGVKNKVSGILPLISTWA